MFMWWRLGNDGYAGPGGAARRPRRDPPQPRGQSRPPDGRRRAGGARAPGRAVRLPPGEARRPAPLERGAARRRSARARCSRRSRRRVRRHGAQALDTVIVSATQTTEDVLGVLDLTDEPVAVVPLFETIGDLESAADTVRALLADRAYGAPGRRARQPARGDGRLLRLRQGRRLPGGAVGDLPGAGGARRRSRARPGSS